MKPTKKLFIIKKYIMATSAQDAIKKERNVKPDDVWVDENWLKNNLTNTPDMGFKTK